MYNSTVAASNANFYNRHNRYSQSRTRINNFLHKRMLPGFKMCEMLGWLIFHLCWPLMLALIYHVSGKFNDKTFMTATDFFRIQVFVVSGKAMFLLPFWWLFFVKLKSSYLSGKLLLHIVTALVYTILCLSLFYVVLTGVFGMDYSWKMLLGDVYNLMVTYFLNFALFHAYNF